MLGVYGGKRRLLLPVADILQMEQRTLIELAVPAQSLCRTIFVSASKSVLVGGCYPASASRDRLQAL